MNMKKFKYFLAFLSFALIFGSCEEETYEFGDIKTPTNMQIIADIVGADVDNPNGDGSGQVNFSVTSDNAMSYKFIHNGTEEIVPSGNKTYVFGTTGLHTYEVTILALGTAGVSSSETTSVEVLTLYSPPADLITMLTGDSERTWRIKNEVYGHMGVGPTDATSPIWWAAGPDGKAETAMYDDRYFFNVDGSFTHTTEGFIYGKSVPLTEDFGDRGQTPNGNAEFTHFPFDDYTSIWELSAPAEQETLSLSDKGFLGFYVGGDHSYQILSRTENEMHVKTIDYSGGLAWFFILIAVE